MPEPDLPSLARTLHPILSRRGYKSLQFSFVTKLAHTANRRLPIYDSKVAELFGFSDREDSLDERLKEYITFYEKLRQLYDAIISQNLLPQSRTLFTQMYSPSSSKVGAVKALDFIFWLSGKLGLRILL